MKHILLLAFLSSILIPAASQEKKEQPATTSPITSTVKQMEQRFAKNLTGAAQEMPADKYSYRPTPEQMTFGHLMMHVAEANNTFCSGIAGQPAREAKLAETDPKDKLAAAVKDSFDYCEQVLAKTDDSNLSQSVALFEGQTAPRGAALVRLAASWADHYSMAAIYLRLNNLLPPSASKK